MDEIDFEPKFEAWWKSYWTSTMGPASGLFDTSFKEVAYTSWLMSRIETINTIQEKREGWMSTSIKETVKGWMR